MFRKDDKNVYRKFFLEELPRQAKPWTNTFFFFVLWI